ncbi:MAG: hypothetical protein R3E87_15040 [Burkholderiaceae bacterium]
MSCDACAGRGGKLGGVYRMQCLACCADLVLSTAPDKQRAAGMLAAIARHPDAPDRAAILERVRERQGE